MAEIKIDRASTGYRSPLVGDTRGQWQCTKAESERGYEMYIWERNQCGIAIYEHITLGVRKFHIPGTITYPSTDWAAMVEAAIAENNRRVNLAKAYLRDNDYCD